MNDTIYEASQLISGGDSFRSLAPPARLAVFGDPVAHSKSPIFQNAALRSSGLEMQYVKIHAHLEELTPALKALPAAGFIGANITIPHKAAALAIVDEADDYARKAGAVNTIVVEGERLIGFNTDGPGLLRALREEFYVDLRDLRVLLLGAGGGAGRAIAVQCAFESCERLVLVNRTFEKATSAGAGTILLLSKRPARRPGRTHRGNSPGRACPPRPTLQERPGHQRDFGRHEAHRSTLDPRRTAHREPHGLRHRLCHRKVAPDRGSRSRRSSGDERPLDAAASRRLVFRNLVRQGCAARSHARGTEVCELRISRANSASRAIWARNSSMEENFLSGRRKRSNFTSRSRP